MASGALSDLRVIECAQGVPGPFCAKLLADYGADVVKIEPPGGDRSRLHGPFPSDHPHPEKSGQFLYLNANKRSIVLDLQGETGRRALRHLVRTADILVIDLPAERLRRLKLTYAALRRLNQRLIMASVTPFGLSGPYRDYTATDLTLFHLGGMGRATPYNEVTDLEASPPLWAGGYQAEYMTGMTAAAAVMAAIFHREAYGEGQLVDIGGMESVANMLRAIVPEYTFNPEAVIPTRLKTGFGWVMPCKDGYVSIALNSEEWWRSFRAIMQELGEPDWVDSELFSTAAGRVANGDALEQLVTAWMRQQLQQDVYERALSRRMPCFPVNSMEQVANSRQFQFRHFLEAVPHPVAGTVTQPGPPARLTGTPWAIQRPAPLHDEHTVEVLQQVSARPAEAPSVANIPSGRPRGNKPLQGFRVLDFGWVLAVPHATAWLGILGAEVIRVESAGRLDIARGAGMRLGADGVVGLNRSSMFNGLNLNKKGITLNLGDPRGLELAKALVAVSDVVTENFAAGVFEKLGLGYEAIKGIKPDIVMLSGSPLGQSGPDRDATGWGPNTQAYAGLPHITGYEGGPPSGIGGYYPDYIVGVAMAFAMLTALHHRARTGEGQFIEVAMAETVATMIPEAIIEYTMNGRETPRRGNSDPRMCPHGIYPCGGEDTWVAIAAAGDAEWGRLRAVIGDPTWSLEPAFETLEGRQASREVIDRGLAEWTRGRTHFEVMHTLQAAGVAAGASTEVRELLADPHLRERGLFVEVDHPEVGPKTMVGLPGKFSAVPVWDFAPAPLLGEHNAEIFQGLLGVTEDEFARLVEERVIF